ncbi:MAG: 2,3-dimethylmalate dehydratase large subunit [Promethearchaeota archaeon]|nr:MAG: 2,3-dimethylmalate dehydratase large subunit [Candidatus Lokiarchaeota archaeon]
MGKTLTEKIIENHLVEGTLERGSDISIKIDQTLTQDATGTMAYLQFEAMGVPKVKTDLSVSYVDHNTLQTDYRNKDDHFYLKSIAQKYGIYFSRPGNGICHQLNLEMFSFPGKTLLGSDSHTPTGGGVGMIAIGAGGLDVAAAMAGEPFSMKMPKVVNVHLTGTLPDFVSAKDVILEVLRRIGVKGAVNKILEYTGPGIKTLSVPERGTITNMGTETGATSSIFPSDEITKKFLEAQERGEDWVEMLPDEDAEYDETIEINLSELVPLISLPHSPGNVKTIREVEGKEVDQVCIGSCTNSSLRDLKIVANLLKGKKISDDLDLTISPGSRQVVQHLVDSGEMSYLVEAGARILENTCGPCIGMGLAPNTDAISLRTFNRNFLGRCGTESADVYLVSPEAAVAAALTGKITDPRDLEEYPEIQMPEKFIVNKNLLLAPPTEAEEVEIIRGPNIKPLPEFPPIPKQLEGETLLKVGDDITTDHIMPAGAEILPLRSNIPGISEYVFNVVDPDFPQRAKEKGGGFIIGGENYGQGSSREHAAIAPKYLGIKAVIVKSFARIHLANLVNFGIVPLTFKNKDDYNKIEQGDELEVDLSTLVDGDVKVKNKTKGIEISVTHNMGAQELEVLKEGGKLPYIKKKHQ